MESERPPLDRKEMLGYLPEDLHQFIVQHDFIESLPSLDPGSTQVSTLRPLFPTTRPHPRKSMRFHIQGIAASPEGVVREDLDWR